MRQYLIGSWSNADEYDYSGEQLMGNRLGASREVPHFLANGRANVAKYGDNTAKPTKVPLKQRILPQASRVDKLRSEAIELEQAFKAGEFTAEEYTLLRDVQFKKLRRAEELLKKAITPVQKEEETGEYGVEIYPCSHDMAQDDDGCKDEPFAWLSSENSLKKILQRGCKAAQGVVHFSHKARAYWQELKEV